MASIHSIYIFLFVCLFLEHLDHLYWITRSGALNSKNKEIICVTLRIIQHMVMSSDLVGPGLVPFYRQLLPMFNKYKTYEGKINLICILCVCVDASHDNYHTVVTSIEFNNTSDLSFCLQWLVAIWSIICRKRAAMWVFWLKKHYRYWNGMAVKMHLSILNTWYRRMNPVYLTEIYKPLSVWDDFRYLFLFIMMLYLFLHHIEFFIGKVLLNY